MFELTHGLSECSTFATYQVCFRYTSVSKEDFTEVAIRSHVGDRTNLNSRSVHRNNDFADTCVRRTFAVGATDEVAIVSVGAKTCPDLLAVDDPFVSVIAC